jgi:hypothetical protein
MESALLVLDPHVPLEQPAELEGAEVDGPDPIPISSRPTYSPTQTVETFTQPRFQRMPPLVLT